MKMAVTVQEVEGEGLVSFMGKRILIMCANYFYCGDLVGVNDTCVKLENAGIVYETGEWESKSWKDYQRIGNVYVSMNAIESWSEGK